jgi:hypothetical protein
MASLTETSFVSLTPPLIDEKGNGSTVMIEESMLSAEGSITLTEENVVPTPKRTEQKQSAFTPLISERAVDQPRPLKVIYIGAGISGILAAIKFRQAVPDLDLTIYEKNPDLGGTWYENQYPGCACGELAILLSVRITLLNKI